MPVILVLFFRLFFLFLFFYWWRVWCSGKNMSCIATRTYTIWYAQRNRDRSDRVCLCVCSEYKGFESSVHCSVLHWVWHKYYMSAVPFSGISILFIGRILCDETKNIIRSLNAILQKFRWRCAVNHSVYIETFHHLRRNTWYLRQEQPATEWTYKIECVSHADE